MKKMQKGFTLVEIMIVVAIIAILAAIAIPNFLAYRAEARTKTCIENMNNIRTSAESWRTNHDPTAVPGMTDIVGTESTKYIRKATLTCPEGGEYTITEVDGALTVTCGSGHTDHKLP